MSSAACKHRISSRNPIVEGWLEDVFAVTVLSDYAEPSPIVQDKKIKRQCRQLQVIDPNMVPTPASPATPSPKKAWSGSPRKRSLPAKEVDAPESEDELQMEETPRPRRTRVTQAATSMLQQRSGEIRIARYADDTQCQVPQIPGYSSAIETDIDSPQRPASKSQSSASSTTRSRSPVKNMSDLYLADKPILNLDFEDTLMLATDVADLYKVLKALKNGKGVVPALTKDEVVQIAGSSEDLDSYMFDKETAMDRGKEKRLLRELEEIDEIRKATKKCRLDEVAEPAWNDEVHSRILRLALKTCDGVEHQNITTARLVPSLVPRHIGGGLLNSKMVDYSISLVPNQDMHDAIIRLLKNEAYELQTINQTRSDPLRFRPIAISIETKKASLAGQGARIQLGMWVAAHFNRIRALKDESLIMPTLPLISVAGAEWHLHFARDCDKQIEIIGDLHLGDTRSLLGCYKLLAGLRCLCGWVTTKFKDWFEGNVLQASSVE